MVFLQGIRIKTDVMKIDFANINNLNEVMIQYINLKFVMFMELLSFCCLLRIPKYSFYFFF